MKQLKLEGLVESMGPRFSGSHDPGGIACELHTLCGSAIDLFWGMRQAQRAQEMGQLARALHVWVSHEVRVDRVCWLWRCRSHM